MYRPLRMFWTLAAIAGATVVGVMTHDAGFVAITFLGGLWVPRLLGLAGPGWRRRGLAFGGCGGAAARGRWGRDRLDTWHREAHSETAS
jgi:hypothetical protein